MLVLKDGHVLTCDPARRRWERADVVIEGKAIRAVGPDAALPFLRSGSVRSGMPIRVIDAAQRIVIPGLVNAHIHSNESFEQGAYDQMPLEVWLGHCYPALARIRLPARIHYLRAMMCCAQSLRAGVTALHDDLLNPAGDPAVIGGAMEAYREAGLKATVAVTFGDRPYLDGFPWLRELVPADLRTEIEALPAVPLDQQVATFRAFAQQWAGDGRLRLSLGPRGPQRCTPTLMARMAELSAEFDLPLHMHVLESRTQAVTAQLMYGKTFVAVLQELGLLTPRLTLNHAIWLTAADIDAMGAAGCSTTHNPLSNMKLGSGVAPVHRLMQAGVNVALGTDGPTTSDTADQIEVIRAASLLHKLTAPDPQQWIGAEEALLMATINGARSCRRQDEIGSLEPGKSADVTLLDRTHWGFVPLHDPVRQLAYSATSEAVDTVIVDGKILMEGRKILSFDEAAIRGEVREMAEHFRRDIRPVMERAARRLEPYLRAMCARAMTEPIPATENPRFW